MPSDAPSNALAQIEAHVSALLRALAALQLLQRNLHPARLAATAAGLEPHAEVLRAAHVQPAWPDPYSALRPQLDASAAETLAACDALGEDNAALDPLMAAFRGLRHLPRALEVLYPLAGILPPVNRFFLEPAQGSNAAFARRFLTPPSPNTGVMCHGAEANDRRAVWMYAPETYTPSVAHPLIVALHGGSGRGRGFLWSWVREARSRGAILVAPTSLGETWSLQDGEPDATRLANLVAFVRQHWTIDTSRLLLTGMSDGGTFTYLAGLSSTSPFTHLAPISAAFHPMLVGAADPARLKSLPIHVTHGALDWMFPIDMAREARDFLTHVGGNVTLREVPDLSHTYPADENAGILDWLGASPPP